VAETRRSLAEWAVLGLLGESPAHGFALARALGPGTELGRVLTVRRPLVYRALDRLVVDGFATADRTEPGKAGPHRTIHRITDLGRRRLASWLGSPVTHIRDLRVELLLKLVLLRRAGRDRGLLIARQREALRTTLEALLETGGEAGDEVDMWRRHTARAVSAYLDDLAAGDTPAGSVVRMTTDPPAPPA